MYMTTTHTNTEAQRNAEIAETIRQQIPMWLHMALGIRDRYIVHRGLRFKATGTRTCIFEITLDEARDLYDLTVYTERCKKGHLIPTRTIRYLAEGVDAGQMIDILDRIDRGHIEL